MATKKPEADKPADKAIPALPLIESAETLKRLLKVFEGLAAVSEVLEKVGSVDQAMRERESMIVAHGKTLADLQDRVKRAHEDYAATLPKTKELVQDAEAKAKDIIARAEAEAVVKARAIIDGANEAAERAAASAASAVEAAKAKIAEAQGEVNAARALTAEYKRKAEEEAKRYEVLRDQVEALKARFG